MSGFEDEFDMFYGGAARRPRVPCSKRSGDKYVARMQRRHPGFDLSKAECIPRSAGGKGMYHTTVDKKVFQREAAAAARAEKVAAGKVRAPNCWQAYVKAHRDGRSIPEAARALAPQFKEAGRPGCKERVKPEYTGTRTVEERQKMIANARAASNKLDAWIGTLGHGSRSAAADHFLAKRNIDRPARGEAMKVLWEEYHKVFPKAPKAAPAPAPQSSPSNELPAYYFY
jgi:hypothetical protein